jgi:hypothetical protein
LAKCQCHCWAWTLPSPCPIFRSFWSCTYRFKPELAQLSPGNMALHWLPTRLEEVWFLPSNFWSRYSVRIRTIVSCFFLDYSVQHILVQEIFGLRDSHVHPRLNSSFAFPLWRTKPCGPSESKAGLLIPFIWIYQETGSHLMKHKMWHKMANVHLKVKNAS